MVRNDPELPLVFARPDAARAGLSAGQVGRRAAREWVRLRHGWYTDRPGLAAEMRWRAEMLAVVRAHRRPLVVSHASAARAYGWPSPVGGWGVPSFTATCPPGRRRSGVWIALAHLDDADVESHGPIMLTARARTVVDCARRLAPRDALAIADAAVRGGVPPDALRLVLRQRAGWPGVAGRGW